MNQFKKQRIVDKFIEIVKFDGQYYKLPLVFAVLCSAGLLHSIGRHSTAFNIICKMCCTGWWGSLLPASRYIKKLHSGSSKQNIRLASIREKIYNNTQADDRTDRFFCNPSELFVGIMLVVKEFDGHNKGVVIINYSSYFVMIAKLFDIERIASRYIIVLEPSWAGFCDMSILIFTQIDDPVVVMTFEARDRKFLEYIDTNLIPVDLGNGWWVDHRMFKPSSCTKRDFDIIMVAAWAPYKRHYEVFKALKELKTRGKSYRVVLAGYSGSLETIKFWANYFGISDWITFYDSITPAEVGKLYARSKVNILWSRFEGNNRAIIEGMLCDTPCIIRTGHNYGEDYEYINSKTGEFANESDLPDKLVCVIENFRSYSPRQYITSEHSCIVATERLQQVISKLSYHSANQKSKYLAVKLNMLDGMEYFHTSDSGRFRDDYQYLASCVKQRQ